jgi:3-oxoacyl-[acyl-carrier protein] reductase
MLIDLTGKTAIVTGAGRGIGRVIARTLAAEGVTVALLDIRNDLLDEARAEWAKAGHKGLFVKADVRDKASVTAAVAEIHKGLGRIDILVNNAGVAAGARIEALDEAVWDDNFDTNTKGTFLVAQAVAPIMKAQKSGRIINAASFAIIIPSIGSAAYAASKAAVVSFTRVLAGELGPFNVTVNCYSPGMIPTEMNGYAAMPEARQNRLLDTLTLRRWGEPGDVAKLICFLASDLSAYITGAMIDVSGGKFATQIPAVAYE